MAKMEKQNVGETLDAADEVTSSVLLYGPGQRVNVELVGSGFTGTVMPQHRIDGTNWRNVPNEDETVATGYSDGDATTTFPYISASAAEFRIKMTAQSAGSVFVRLKVG